MAAHERYSKVGPYILMDTLGVGAFGKVKLAVHSVTYERFACKILDKKLVRDRDQSVHVHKEIDVMQRLSHRNIVQLVNVYSTPARVFIIMELVTGGELFEEILRHKRLPEPYARFYFRQLIDGVQHCHERGVYHRDLKPENLLLGDNKTLKITDFGLSTLKSGGQSTTASVTGSLTLHTQCGTPNYVAPEIITLDPEGYKGPKVDAWACGVILYVLVAGALPFDAPEMDVLFEMIIRGRLTYPSYFSHEVVDLIGNMLKTDPSERFTLADVKQHPWFNGPVQESIDEFPSPSPQPLPSNTTASPSTQSPQSAAADIVPEEEPKVNKVYHPSPLSQYALQGSNSKGLQQPVTMRTADSLDIGIRAESAETSITVNSSHSPQVESPAPVLPAAISDNGSYNVDHSGNPAAHNTVDPFDDSGPVMPPNTRYNNPLDRFRSQVLGDSSSSYVPSSDDDHEYEDVQELRPPPGLQEPPNALMNGTVSSVPAAMRRTRSLDSLSRYGQSVSKQQSTDSNFTQEEYGMTHPGIRGRVKRQLWDRAAQAWRVPAQSYHMGKFVDAANGSSHAEPRQEEQRLAQGPAGSVQKRTQAHLPMQSSGDVDTRLILDHEKPQDQGLVPNVNGRRPVYTRHITTNYGHRSLNGHQVSNDQVTSDVIRRAPARHSTTALLANGVEQPVPLVPNSSTLHVNQDQDRLDNMDIHAVKRRPGLVRSHSHDGKFSEDWAIGAGSQYRTGSTYHTAQSPMGAHVSNSQRREPNTEQRPKPYRERRKRRRTGKKQSSGDKPSSNRERAVRFKELKAEHTEVQNRFSRGSYWVENEARKMGWCRMMRDYDMIPDNEEFGLSSADLNELWREGLTKENFIKADSDASTLYGQGSYKLSRSSQYLSSHANRSSQKHSAHPRKAVEFANPETSSPRRNVSSPSRRHDSGSSSSSSGKEESVREQSEVPLQGGVCASGGSSSSSERRNEETKEKHQGTANVSPPIMARPLTIQGRSSPSAHPFMQEDEAVRRAGRRQTRQVSFAPDSVIAEAAGTPPRTSLEKCPSPVARNGVGGVENPQLSSEQTVTDSSPAGTRRELKSLASSDLVAAQSVHSKCAGGSPRHLSVSADKRERSPLPGGNGLELQQSANGPHSAVPSRLLATPTSDCSVSEDSNTHSSSSVPTRHDTRSSSERRRRRHREGLPESGGDKYDASTDKTARSTPVGSMSSGAMASGGSEGLMSTPEETAFGQTEVGGDGFDRAISGITWRDEEDRVEPDGRTNSSGNNTANGLYETRTSRSSSASRPPPKPSLTNRSSENAVSPFLLDIPGPKGRSLPRAKPWSGFITSTGLPKIRPLASYGVKSYTQFHTLQKPETCFQVIKELMVQYGCPVVKGTVVKEKERFKIRCESTKEGACASAVVNIYKSDNLCTVNMKKKGKGDFDEFVEFYSRLYHMYCERVKYGGQSREALESGRRRTGRQTQAEVHFEEAVSTSTEDRTATTTSMRSVHGSTVVMGSAPSSELGRSR